MNFELISEKMLLYKAQSIGPIRFLAAAAVLLLVNNFLQLIASFRDSKPERILSINVCRM